MQINRDLYLDKLVHAGIFLRKDCVLSSEIRNRPRRNCMLGTRRYQQADCQDDICHENPQIRYLATIDVLYVKKMPILAVFQRKTCIIQ